MNSLRSFAAEKLAALESAALRRRLAETARAPAHQVTRNGQALISFSCNDYLGLSTHPAVVEAAIAALHTYGLGSGGSRLITGNHPLYAGLEARLARLKDTESAIVFGSGYLANVGIVPALAGVGDLVILDSLSHACLLAGAKLSGAEAVRFAHNDMEELEDILDRRRAGFGHCLILTEGVFSMDGDLAPLPELAALAERYDCWLMTDDAHALGVVGRGRGSSFAFGPKKLNVPLQMGTLSKSVGAYGGYLCADRAVIELLHNRARSFVYETGLPPAVVAGASAALDFIAENPSWIERAIGNAQRFARALDLPKAQSSIVPLILGDEALALKAMALLAEKGFLVVAVRPPTVPPGTARLRFAFSAAHEPGDIDALAEAVRMLVLPLRA